MSVWCDRIVIGGILFLILFTPFAFGSVHPWAFALMEATIFLMVTVWAGSLLVAGSRERGRRGQRPEVEGQRSEVRSTTHFEIRNSNSEIPYSPSPPAPCSLLLAKRLALPLTLFFVLILFQLLPLPPSLLRLISPSTFELYTQTLAGWPSEAPYAELTEGARSREQSEIPAFGSKLRAPRSMLPEPKTQSPTPVILPTLDEVKAGAPIPEFGEQGGTSQKSEVGSQKSALNKIEGSELSSQSAIRNPRSEISSSSILHAPGSLLPATWLPLSLAPSRTRSDLLKIASYAALFFLVLLYPFAETRGQTSEIRGQRLHAPGSMLPGPGSMLHAPRSLLIVVLFSGLLIAVIGFVQRFTWNGMILWFFVPYDWGAAGSGNDPRASGPFINPDHFANYLALIFPLALGTAIYSRYLFRRQMVGAMRIFAGLATFLMFTGILLSLSRSGWIAMLLGVVLLVWLSPWDVRWQGARSREHGVVSDNWQSAKSKAQSAGGGPQSSILDPRSSILDRPSAIRISLIIISVLLIVSLFFVGPRGREQVDIRLGATVTEDAGLWGRTSIWSDTLKMIRDFPLMGVGLGSWQDLFQRYQSPPWRGDFYREAHNDYLELVAETGMIGFILLACFFWLGGRRLWKYLRSSTDRRSKALIAMLCSALAVMAFHEFFDFSLQIPANAFLFTLLFALALRVALSSEAQSAKRQAQGIGSAPLPTSGRLLPAPCSLLLAVLLFFAALNQEMTSYPYNLRVPGSIAEAGEMILAHPALPTPHMYLLRVMDKRAPLEWEIKELRAALWLNPTNPSLRDPYAGALLRAGKKEDGLREISRSIVNAPSFSEHGYLNGRFLPWLSMDEKNAVEQGFKEAIARSYPGALDGLASLYSRTGRFADEAGLLEEVGGRATEGKHNTDLSVRAATSYLKARDPKAAETLLRKIISIALDDPRPYQLLAVMIYAPQKEIDKVNKIISEGIKNGAPPFELHLALAEAMQKAGAAEETKKALSLAEEALQKATKNGQEPFRLYISLAEVAQRLGLQEEAKSALVHALELRPSSSETLHRLAYLYLQENNFDRAAYHFRRYTDLNPNASDAFYHLGLAEEGRYHFAAAGKAYNRALELAPGNAGFQSRYDAFKQKVAKNQNPNSAASSQPPK